MLQNIAHFFNLSNCFFQVVHRKRLGPVLLVEWPVLLVCVSLLRDLQKGNMQISVKRLAGTISCSGMHMEMCCSGLQIRDFFCVRAYFHFHREGRHMGIFSTTHNHLLKRVPFIVATYRTFLLHRLSYMFIFDSKPRLCSCCCARSALEGPLHPSSHGPAKLRRGKTELKLCNLHLKNVL